MKNKLFNFLLLTTLILFTSCLGDDVDIESNRRLLVKGKIQIRKVSHYQT